MRLHQSTDVSNTYSLVSILYHKPAYIGLIFPMFQAKASSQCGPSFFYGKGDETTVKLF